MIVANSNKYDLGDKNSPYFRDENKNCTVTRQDWYCNCNGEPYSITIEEQLPYKQKYEILAPVFISTTWGSEKFYKSEIKKDMYKMKGKSFVHIKYPLKVGDIIKVQGDCYSKYFIKSKQKKRDNYGNFIVEIKRLDGNSLVQLDVDRFKDKKLLLVTGYFKNQ